MKTYIQEFQQQVMVEQGYYQNVPYAVVKIQDLLKTKEQKVSDKVLRDKAFNIAKNPKYDGYQRGLASNVYKFFDKSLKGAVLI